MPAISIGSPKAAHLPPLLLTGLIGTVAMWILHIVLREVYSYAPGSPVRVTVTALLVGAFALLIVGQIQVSRAADEFHRQVQFLALSIAFPLALAATFAIGFFAAEGMLAGADPRDLGAITLLAGAIGYAVAWRHYRELTSSGNS